MLCESWSLTHICKRCRTQYLTPSLYTKKILGDILVYSFYKYSDIETLLHTKHTDLGFYIYSILAQQSMKHFAKTFEYSYDVAAIGIDDHVRHGYSHTAILAKALRSKVITPHYGRLRARSHDTYSSQSFQYRLLHPRRFESKPFVENDVILVDDILTTGRTLSEAAETLHREGKKVLFCLTLADADKYS